MMLASVLVSGAGTSVGSAPGAKAVGITGSDGARSRSGVTVGRWSVSIARIEGAPRSISAAS